MVNERDEIGSDLVPDYLTSVKDGAFYGWPWSYYGGHVDDARRAAAARRWWPRRVVPDYALGSHVAPLGLAFSDARGMPPRSRAAPSSASTARGTASPLSGYKVVFVPFIGGRPAGRRSISSPASSAPTARRRAARSAWRSTGGRPAGGRRRGQCDLAGGAHRSLIAKWTLVQYRRMGRRKNIARHRSGKESSWQARSRTSS